MKRSQFDNYSNPGIPLLFKLWFAFVALLGVCIFVGYAVVAAKLINSGPTGIGEAIGKAVAAYQREAK